MRFICQLLRCNTYFWTGLEDGSILCTSKELISGLSAVDDDDPSIGQANFEHESVDLAPHMVGMCRVRAKLEEASDNGPSSGPGEIGFLGSWCH